MRSLFVVDSKVACDFIRFRQGSVLNRFSKLFLQDLLKNLTSDYCCWNKSVQTDQSFYVLRKPASITSMVSCTNRCVHFLLPGQENMGWFTLSSLFYYFSHRKCNFSLFPGYKFSSQSHRNTFSWRLIYQTQHLNSQLQYRPREA